MLKSIEDDQLCAGDGFYFLWDTRLASQKPTYFVRVSRFLLRRIQREKIINCPSDKIGCPEEVAEQLAGEEVSRDSSKGAKPLD